MRRSVLLDGSAGAGDRRERRRAQDADLPEILAERIALPRVLVSRFRQQLAAAYRNVLLARSEAHFTVRGDNVIAAPWDGYGLSVFESAWWTCA